MKNIPKYYHVILSKRDTNEQVAKYTYTRRSDANHAYDELMKDRVATSCGTLQVYIDIEYVC